MSEEPQVSRRGLRAQKDVRAPLDHLQDLIQHSRDASLPVGCSKCQLFAPTNITEVTEHFIVCKEFILAKHPTHPDVSVLRAQRERLNESPGSPQWDLPSLCSCPYHGLLYASQSRDCPGPWDLPIPCAWEYKEAKRTGGKKKKIIYFGDHFKDWIFLFSPSFFPRRFSIPLGSSGAKLCQQSHARSMCGGACTSAAGDTASPPAQEPPSSSQGCSPASLAEQSVSVQLFTQPLSPALVNRGNAHGEQPEWCHPGLL